jgi:hypothetical protein
MQCVIVIGQQQHQIHAKQTRIAIRSFDAKIDCINNKKHF